MSLVIKHQPVTLQEERLVHLQEQSFDEREIDDAVNSLRSGMVVMGKKCKQFEQRWNQWQGCNRSVFVNSGSSANLLIIAMLKSLRTEYQLKPDDEILVPAVTWSTTLFPIIQMGLKPVLVDVKEHTFNIDVKSCQFVLSKKTKAIFVVHLLGNPCNMDEIFAFAIKNDLIIIEDCCEATGAKWNNIKVGNFGVASAFSFMFAHHMTTIEGGMVCTPFQDDYLVLKAQRAHGWIREFTDEEKEDIIEEYNVTNDKFCFWDLGFNVRPTEINAAFGLNQLLRIDDFIRIRQRNFEVYWKQLFYYDPIVVQELESVKAERSNFAFGFYIKDHERYNRDALIQFLADSNIESRPLVAGNLQSHPFSHLYLDKPRVPLNVSYQIQYGGIYLPNHQGMTEDDVLYVTNKVKEFFDRD